MVYVDKYTAFLAGDNHISLIAGTPQSTLTSAGKNYDGTPEILAS
jgi:hypothetical protein